MLSFLFRIILFCHTSLFSLFLFLFLFSLLLLVHLFSLFFNLLHFFEVILRRKLPQLFYKMLVYQRPTRLPSVLLEHIQHLAYPMHLFPVPKNRSHSHTSEVQKALPKSCGFWRLSNQCFLLFHYLTCPFFLLFKAKGPLTPRLGFNNCKNYQQNMAMVGRVRPFVLLSYYSYQASFVVKGFDLIGSRGDGLTSASAFLFQSNTKTI